MISKFRSNLCICRQMSAQQFPNACVSYSFRPKWQWKWTKKRWIALNNRYGRYAIRTISPVSQGKTIDMTWKYIIFPFTLCAVVIQKATIEHSVLLLWFFFLLLFNSSFSAVCMVYPCTYMDAVLFLLLFGFRFIFIDVNFIVRLPFVYSV